MISIISEFLQVNTITHCWTKEHIFFKEIRMKSAWNQNVHQPEQPWESSGSSLHSWRNLDKSSNIKDNHPQFPSHPTGVIILPIQTRHFFLGKSLKTGIICILASSLILPKYPPGNYITYPTFGKGKSSSQKVRWEADMWSFPGVYIKNHQLIRWNWNPERNWVING